MHSEIEMLYSHLWNKFENLQVKLYTAEVNDAKEMYQELGSLVRELSSDKYIKLINRDIKIGVNSEALYFRISIWLSNYRQRSLMYRVLNYKSKRKMLGKMILIRKSYAKI